ncbi:MAG TPA: YlbF family regulator [Verrucomicrobiae bacterium]|jgi:cell fate (sporulation/competence/biofilm development) regulator YlbF (YheA/YmcA/DUF963 family)
MQTNTQIDDPVRQKTLELCETIIQQAQFQNIRRRVESFMADNGARQQYESLSEKGRSLHERQHQGLPLDGREVAAFDTERDALLSNPVAKGFIDAQEELQELQQGVQQYVSKTFELGRVPSEEDLQEGSCGHGCGCHH